MKRIIGKISFLFCIVSMMLAGCGHSSFSNNPAGAQGGSESITITGSVWAVSGTLGAPRTAGAQQLMNWVVGKSALAASQTIAPVAGVTIMLYTLDSSGAVTGDALATTQSDAAGSYTLTVIADPSVPMLVKAEGVETLSAFVSGPVVDISPLSTAAVTAVTQVVSNFSSLTILELKQITEAVRAAYSSIDPSDTTSNARLSAALAALAVYDEETNSLIVNSVATQQVCGTVTSNISGALAESVIVARDFNDQVLRAQTKSNASGAYCLDLQAGDYIIGARNQSSASYASSEWYTANGGTTDLQSAAKVTIASGDPVKTINFELAPGARLSGTVTASEQVTLNGNTWLVGAALQNIQIIIQNYNTHALVDVLHTGDDGSYQVNLAPGDYLLMAANRTLQPFASEAFDGENGANVQQRAMRVTLTLNQTKSVELGLEAGKSISGLVKNNSGAAAPGQPVYIDAATGGSAANLRTNLDGKYCVWLKPASYRVHSRGQTAVVDVTNGSTSSTDFGAPMSEVTVKLSEAANHDNSISGAILSLRVPSTWDFTSQARTRGDGSAILYTPYSASATTNYYYLETKFDNRRYFASQLYSGKTNKANADVIAISSEQTTHDLGTVQIAAGGILTGRVLLSDATTPASNQPVQIRKEGDTAADLLVNTRTNGDGTFSISLPEGSNYARIVLGNTDGNTCTNDCSVNLNNSVGIVAGQVTNLADVTLR